MLVLTGADPYYCAGVNLSATIQPMHPKKLHSMIVTNNQVCPSVPVPDSILHIQAVFDQFLDFPKPIIIAANGPAIGETSLKPEDVCGFQHCDVRSLCHLSISV